MIDHFGINCADFAKASAFYDEVLGVLGYSRQMDFGVAIYNAAIDLGAESLHEPRLWPIPAELLRRVRPRPRWQQCRGGLP